MLKTPSEEDLRLVPAVSLRYLLDGRMIESRRTGERAPSLDMSSEHRYSVVYSYLEGDVVLLADLDNVGMAHERVQVDLVDDGERDALVQEFLDVFDSPIGHLV